MQSAVVKDIALGVAQCMLILGILMALPLLGVFAIVFLPLPVLFYRLKLGRNNGAMIVAITLGLLCITTGSPGMDLMFLGGLLGCGLFLGECIERHMSITQIMTFSSVGVVGTIFAGLMLIGGFQGQSPAELISSYMAGYPEMFTRLYQDMGIALEQARGLVALIIMVFPGMLMTSFLSIMLINILIIRAMLAKRGIILSNLSCLRCYRSPDFLIWAVIGITASLVLTHYQYDSGLFGGLRYMSVNLMLVFLLIYFFQGIAIVSFFFEKKNVPAPVRIFCYTLVALQFYFSILVIGLGFFDHWADFRKIHTDSC